MRLLRLAFIVALAATPACADPEQCREVTADYNELMVAINAAIRDYERCVTASLARDDCGAEFIELQATHRDFEASVDAHIAACRSR